MIKSDLNLTDSLSDGSSESDSNSQFDTGNSTLERKYWQIQLGQLASVSHSENKHYVSLNIFTRRKTFTGTFAPFKTRDEITKLLGRGGMPIALARSIHNFAHVIRTGDVIVAHNQSNNAIHIGVVKSDYLSALPSKNKEDKELHRHVRIVDWRIEKQLKMTAKINLVSNITSEWEQMKQKIMKAFPEDNSLREKLELKPDEMVTFHSNEVTPAPDKFAGILDIMERTNNVLFYGPPGTGKTWMVDHFSAYFLLRNNVSFKEADSYWDAVQLSDAIKAKSLKSSITSDSNENKKVLNFWALDCHHESTSERWAKIFAKSQQEFWVSAAALALESAVTDDIILIQFEEQDNHYIGILRVIEPLKTRFKDGELFKGIVVEPLGKIPQIVDWNAVVVKDNKALYSDQDAELYKLHNHQTREFSRLIKNAGYSVSLPVSISENSFAASQNFLEVVTFHQSFAYEDFIEGLRPTTDKKGQIRYKVVDGAFKRFSLSAEAAWKEYGDKAPKFILIIDEINRANIAKVFGELISLIEDDRRLGEKNELTAILPYSQSRFGVPPNLYIIGTMNTADRSLALLDVALRRRFTFVPMMPDSTQLGMVEDVDLGSVLLELNTRLNLLLDQDHQIGHAYFLTIKGPDDTDGLLYIWNHKIIPLLQEYFYGDDERLYALLGEDFMAPFRVSDSTEKAIGNFYHSDVVKYEFLPLTSEDLLKALKNLGG